jgi:hypothetical protein
MPLLANCPIEDVARLATVSPVEVVRRATPFCVMVPEALKAPPAKRLRPETVRVEVAERVEEALVVKNGMALARTEAAGTLTFPPALLPLEAEVMRPEASTVRLVLV